MKPKLARAHSHGRVRAADRIITLERGRLTEMGGHEDLLRKGGRYAQLYAKQMGLHAATA